MAVETQTSERAGAPGLGSRLLKVFQFEEAGVLAALLLICVLLVVFTENFKLPQNIINVLRQASYIGIMAVGMVFVLSQGDVDLSVGNLYNLVAMCMARALVEGLPVSLVIPFGLVLGALLGLLNGGLSILLDIPTIIVTLGTMSVFSGLSLVVSGATSIASFPKDNWFFQTFSGKLFGVPASVFMWLGVAVIGYILYSHTAFGRHICAIGANRQAATYAGINVNRNRLITMMLMGVICAVASVGVLGFLKAADPSVGKGSELMVISAAIIGGTSLFGGAGSILGAVIGCLIIMVIRNGLVLLNVSVYWQGVVTGATVIAAVALDYLIKRRRK